MKKIITFSLMVVCAVAVALLVHAPMAKAELITFDGSGYVAGSTPPVPWTDRYTWYGAPDPDLVYHVVAGAGTGGSQALTVYDNGLWEGAAVYILPTPLTQGSGPKRISIMLDPSQNDGWGLNFTSFGGVATGRGGWMQDETAVYRGVNFEKEDWDMKGGDDATDFMIVGPGGVFGYFVASGSQNYYTITFDINAEFTSILITVTYPGGTTVTQTTAWDGGDINKVWLWDSDDEYSGQPVYYDNLSISGNLLYAAYSGSGLYQYDGTAWTRLNTSIPESMVASGSAFYVNFTGSGLYKYDGAASIKLNSSISESMIASGPDLYATFTGSGLYKYNGATWSRLHTSIPESMAVSGSALYATFTGSGLYKYNGAAWSRLHTSIPESMAVSGSALYATFTGSGLYKYDGTTWTRIHKVVPESMRASASALYANFTGSGLYKYNGATWTRLNTTIPAGMIASDSTLYVNFTGSGLWTYNGATWTRINKTIPESMMVSGSAFYASFTGSGLWTYDGTTWTRLNKTVPESMIVNSPEVPLYCSPLR